MFYFVERWLSVVLKKNNRCRLNIYLVPELKDYVIRTAEEYGLSQSAFVTMVLSQYKQQMISLEAMTNLKHIVSDKSVE